MFMEDANWLDQLKLRGTFGKTGNGMDNSGYYGYRQTFSSNVAAGYPMGINLGMGNLTTENNSVGKSLLNMGKSV